MPADLLQRIPLPSLKAYTSISVSVLIVCLYYSVSVTEDPAWQSSHYNLTDHDLLNNPDGNDRSIITKILRTLGIYPKEAKLFDNSIEDIDSINGELVNNDITVPPILPNGLLNLPFNDTRTISDVIRDVFSVMAEETICVWTMLNMAYCCLLLVGKSIQKIVFGELRISEEQHLRDKFWNFLFYKFIFIFGVVNVQFLYEVVLWVSWFSVLGWLNLLSQLSKDRFEYLSFSPSTPNWSHFRLIALLSAVLSTSSCMFVISIGVGYFDGLNTFGFMAAECILLTIRTLHTLIRYGMYLYDIRHGVAANDNVSWDKRGPWAYYLDLGFEFGALIIDWMHHLHMLFSGNGFLSMASLVLLMQLRYLTNEIQRKVKKHRTYLWVVNHMEKSYPLATRDDLTNNSDNCAICWERMETARKLPCSHLFHNACLQSWLEQDTSCPTCRLALSVNHSVIAHQNIEHRLEENENAGRPNNHFFQFNGSRYVSWLPNFSVEVTHLNNVLRGDTMQQAATAHTSQLRNMAIQIQQMFPRYPLAVLIADLQVSRSMEITVDNILEGLVPIPPRFAQDFDEGETSDNSATSSGSTTSNGSTSSESGTSSGSSLNQPIRTFIPNTANDYYMAPDYNPTEIQETEMKYRTIGYEIEQGSNNIFGNQNDLLRDESSEDVSLEAQFSLNAVEREKILRRRKDMLMASARQKYVEKNKSHLNLQTDADMNN